MAILKFLEARGLEVDAATRERILACDDPEQLDQWLTRAVTVDDPGALFTD